MIINLWSTPRTGSVWYSNYLKQQYLGSILVTEMFNQYHMDIYHFIHNGKVINSHTYTKGSFYKDYFIDNGTIAFKKVFGEQIRSRNEEEAYRIDLFNQITSDIPLILHNHVAPINDQIRQHLINIAEKNIYIYRKDKRAQLASYAIALSSKQFAQFSDEEETGIVDDINPVPLENLISRIKIWDQLPKQQVIAYEDIEFFNKYNWPKKQNKDYRVRLSDNMISLINSLVSKYENENLTETLNSTTDPNKLFYNTK
jgi:hypothetical protein